jgi:uncharacterized RDD family membrane protein YckC
MVEVTHCPVCGHVNALAAETCENCGEPLGPADTPLHPGETFRDPDDLDLPEPPPKKPNQRSMLPPGAWIRAEGRAAALAEQAAGAESRAAALAEQAADVESEAAALRVLAARMAARRRELADTDERTPRAARPAHYAGFVVRVVAFVIDLVVLAIFTVPLALAGLYGVRAGLVASGSSLGLIDTEEALGRLLGLSWLVMATIYFTAMHSETGQTIGKAVVGIAVRRARDLAAIGVIRSFVRFAAYGLSAVFALLGFLTVMFSPRKRGWHDYLAGTCVVHLAPEEI